MRYLEFKPTPGYENYSVTCNGLVKLIHKDNIVKQYLLNGYYVVDTFWGSKTETLPVHRAVALAWVKNVDPEKNVVVNHLDGNKVNNESYNLEWTTYSGNSFHAVNTDLRSDNTRCRLRDFETGIVLDFCSISQASRYLGYTRDADISVLLRKQFGALIKDRYEFKFAEDTSPWFYESRPEKISPCRYMVVIKEFGKDSLEVYKGSDMLKNYQLYDSPYGKSIPGLVRHANEKFTDKEFLFFDSYSEDKFRVHSKAEKNPALDIVAKKDAVILEFPSLTKAASYFNVSRISITRRLNTEIDLDGWIFTHLLS